MNPRTVSKWVGQCLRKKPLRMEWCDKIIKKAAAEGVTLYKYLCPHCQNWHITKQVQRDD